MVEELGLGLTSGADGVLLAFVEIEEVGASTIKMAWSGSTSVAGSSSDRISQTGYDLKMVIVINK